MADIPPSPGKKTDQTQEKKPGSTRALFIVLGIGLVVLGIIGLAYQISMAIADKPDKDLAQMAVQGIINLLFMAGGYAFGRLGANNGSQ